jgi:hypothetical protein
LLALVGVGVYFFTRPPADTNTPITAAPSKGSAEFVLDDESQEIFKSRGGRLKGTVKVNDQVIVDDSVLLLPIELGDLESGKSHAYSVQIDGFEKLTNTFVVESGAKKQVKIRLISMNDAGFVLNITPPDALVTFDNKPIPGAAGRFESKDLPPGTYVLKVTHNDFFPYEQPLAVDSKTANAPLPITLKPRASLTLTIPRLSGVSVKLIDTTTGQEVGSGTLSDKTPLTLKDLYPDRAYKILASHPDREPLELPWSMPTGQTKDTREITLKSNTIASNNPPSNNSDPPKTNPDPPKTNPDPPKTNPDPPVKPPPSSGPPGILKIGSKPPSQVFINGENKGNTPIKIDLKPGKYKVKFVHPAKGEETKEVTVESGLERMLMHQWP